MRAYPKASFTSHSGTCTHSLYLLLHSHTLAHAPYSRIRTSPSLSLDRVPPRPISTGGMKQDSSDVLLYIQPTALPAPLFPPSSTPLPPNHTRPLFSSSTHSTGCSITSCPLCPFIQAASHPDPFNTPSPPPPPPTPVPKPGRFLSLPDPLTVWPSTPRMHLAARQTVTVDFAQIDLLLLLILHCNLFVPPLPTRDIESAPLVSASNSRLFEQLIPETRIAL
ncbi:hypothetical protein GGR52DRAFT_185863 [Hypoxylon sp. FL1284]|nr:hypothetical protein GGR52DRAFT_185863 [Hypoxylon sp. FL1284]